MIWLEQGLGHLIIRHSIIWMVWMMVWFRSSYEKVVVLYFILLQFGVAAQGVDCKNTKNHFYWTKR